MAQEHVNPANIQSLPGGSPFLTRSCHACNRRKVRCNKVFPCDNCVRLGVDCTFPPPGRKPRKRPAKSNKAKLISRLSLLEREVEKLGAQDVVGAAPAGGSTANLWPSENRIPDLQRGFEKPDTRTDEGPSSPKATSGTLEHQFGRLVIDQNHGTSRYVNHRVLTDLGDQIKELRDLFESPSSPISSSEEDNSLPFSTAPYSETHSPFIFGYHSLAHSLQSYHPSPTISHLLLGVFEENVAPIIRIIHNAALRRLVQTACTNPEGLDKGSEALVFSIYFAAASSMAPEQCLSLLGEDHTALVKRYRFAVEQALARAGFLHTHKLVVLQAAVLFLTCACHPKDAEFVWTMIAVVTRRGLGLGLHRDGSHFGLSPFETEMRRRLWWYIHLLDSQSAEYQATSPQIREGDYDTRLPLNIDDDDLSPDLAEPPQERTGFTEMTLTLIRCEVLISNRKILQMTSSGPNSHEDLFKRRNLAIDEARQVLDEKYLQFCDLDIPIHWVAATIARAALARLWLVSHFSLLTAEGVDANLEPDRCDLLVLTAIEVLEFAYLLETHENTAKWSWLFQRYVQWQPFAFILSELCVRPTSSLSDRAWAAVNRVYERWNTPGSPKEGLVMRPLERLMNRAAAIRDRLRSPGSAFPVESNIQDPVMADYSQGLKGFHADPLAAETASLDIFKDVWTSMGL